MSTLPNIWGPGQLFAYSGMEGATCATSPMVAHTLADRIGLRVFTEPAMELWVQGERGEDPTRKYPRCMPDFEIVTGDAIQIHVVFSDGEKGTIAFAPVDQDSFVATTIKRLRPRWSVGTDTNRPMGSGQHVYPCDEGFIVLAVREQGKDIRFALAHDVGSKQAATAKADKALDADIHGLIDVRRRWYESIDLPASLPNALAKTYRKAVAIMRVNTCRPEGQIRHRWTTPDRWPHRWMWLHDTAYHATGHVYHFPDLAADMLAAVFDTQEDDGRIALLMRPDGNFPEISQSPILAWGVRQAYEASSDRGFLADVYPRVKRYLEYFINTRAFGDTRLYRWAHSDESMDNNPRFDQTSDFGAIDLSCTLCREFEEAAVMAEALGLSDDAENWMTLRQEAADAVNHLLWDESSGQYGDLMPDGQVRVLSTCVTFLPMFAGIVPEDRARQLVALLKDPSKYWRKLPVPTVAADDPTFYPDMWRGPSWINMNYLISEGLARSGFTAEADEIRQRSVETISRWHRHTGCIYEFYDCEDEVPPYAMDRKSRICYAGGFTNISDYHWSAALFVAMCRRLYG